MSLFSNMDSEGLHCFAGEDPADRAIMRAAQASLKVELASEDAELGNKRNRHPFDNEEEEEDEEGAGGMNALAVASGQRQVEDLRNTFGVDRLGGGSPEQAPRRVETSVRGPTGTDEMDVDSSYVLFVDNNNKNESAKLTFFAAMDHQSVGRLGGKVEEYTIVRGPRIRPPQSPCRMDHTSL